MFPAAFGLADQMATAVEASEVDLSAVAGASPTSIAVLGMGGSGIAGDVAGAIGGPRLSIPLVTSRDYEGLRFVGPDTLVFAVSASGQTEETLAATTAALDAGAKVVAVTKGGALGDLVGGAGMPVIAMDPSITQPRAGIGALSLPPLITLGRLGLLDGVDELVGGAIQQVRTRLEANSGDDNAARTLARRIERTQPIIYGAGRLGHTAAMRLKCQVNENAKCPAYAQAMPELCHNEICAWGQHGDVTRQVNTMVFLRHGYEHPQIAKRFDFLASVVAEVVAEIFTVSADGPSDLAQLFDLIVFGDLVSLWMAVEAGVDPGPVPVIMDLKAALTAR